MFKKLTIKNFQSHKKITIRFDPDVTVITGKNDRGKSAIIRALRWVCLNRPGGRGFIHYGALSSSVTLITSKSKSRIYRKVGKGDNYYRLEHRKYKAIGRDVPRVVKDVLMVDEINFQRQHDSNFWFNLTPGQVARELNKLVDLETIDSIQARVAKRLRDKKAELSVCEKRLAEAKATVSQLSWVKPFNVKLGKLDTSYRRTTLKSSKLARIRELSRLVTFYDVRKRASERAIVVAHTANATASKMTRLDFRLSRLAALYRATASAQRAMRRKLPDTESIERTLARSKKVTDRLNHIKSLFTLLKEKEKSLCQNHGQIKDQESKLEKNMNGRCPYCGSILTDKTLI